MREPDELQKKYIQNLTLCKVSLLKIQNAVEFLIQSHFDQLGNIVTDFC